MAFPRSVCWWLADICVLSRAMQDCFRQHPDVYGAELEDDEEFEGGAPVAAAPSPDDANPPAEQEATPGTDEKRARAKEVHSQMKTEAAEKGEHSESDELLPKAAHDAHDTVETVQKTEK